MRGLTVLIVLCAVVAVLLCGPALAGEQKQLQKNAAVQAAQKPAVQKSASTPAAAQGVRCAGVVCPLSAVLVTKERTKQSARAIRVFFRQGVRLNCPLHGGCGK